MIGNEDFTHSLVMNKAQKPRKELPPTNQQLQQNKKYRNKIQV